MIDTEAKEPVPIDVGVGEGEIRGSRIGLDGHCQGGWGWRKRRSEVGFCRVLARVEREDESSEEEERKKLRVLPLLLSRAGLS